MLLQGTRLTGLMIENPVQIHSFLLPTYHTEAKTQGKLLKHVLEETSSNL